MTDSILEAIDQEIAKLTQARTLLSANGSNGSKSTYTGARRGPKPRSGVGISIAASAAPKKSSMTAEGRKRITEAMKKRWAERRTAVKAIKAATPVKRVIGKPAVKKTVKAE